MGIRNPDKVEITSGLTGGETVVIEGNFSLPDKSKVEISKGDEEEKQEGEKKKEEEP